MEKIYLDPEIYYIENVLSRADLEKCQTFARNKENWQIGVHKQDEIKTMDQEIKDIFDKMLVDYIKIAEPNLHIETVPILHKYDPDFFNHKPEEWAMSLHVDNSPNTPLEDVEKGLVFYLNDDFDGGELFYVNKDISYKPVANTLVIHSAFESCRHGVTMVTNGTRYIYTNFYRS
jgi:predicted 2-oxoglutarate/Fe(II)-dependent dioxygenase YbiX